MFFQPLKIGYQEKNILQVYSFTGLHTFIHFISIPDNDSLSFSRFTCLQVYKHHLFLVWLLIMKMIMIVLQVYRFTYMYSFFNIPDNVSFSSRRFTSLQVYTHNLILVWLLIMIMIIIVLQVYRFTYNKIFF